MENTAGTPSSLIIELALVYPISTGVRSRGHDQRSLGLVAVLNADGPSGTILRFSN